MIVAKCPINLISISIVSNKQIKFVIIKIFTDAYRQFSHEYFENYHLVRPNVLIFTPQSNFGTIRTLFNL